MSEPYWEPLAAAPPAPSAMTLIADALLAADAAAIDFTSIPQTYKHLKLVIALRAVAAAPVDVVNMRFNGDAGANYESLWTGWSLAAADNFYNVSSTRIHIGKCPATQADASVFGSGEILIPDYANGAKKKNVSGQTSAATALTTNTSSALMFSAIWASLAAITQLTLTPNGGGNFVTGSRATLFGLA